MTLQVTGDLDFCSSIGDMEKHEQFKKLTKEERINKLQEVYDTYGVKSNEFFVQVKPFIMWTVYRYLRGVHYTFLEDLVNNAYEELVIAFEGGETTHYNKKTTKKPLYGNTEYYKKCKNIGNFVMKVVGSSVAKYRSKHFRKPTLHEDSEQDISDRLNFTDFEEDNNLSYKAPELEDEPVFQHFKFNDKLRQHLATIKETCPRNNVLYNFMLWQEHTEE